MSFLWDVNEKHTKINWIAWSKIISLKEYGGLGVYSLRASNLALFANRVARWQSQSSLRSVSKWSGLFGAGLKTVRSNIFFGTGPDLFWSDFVVVLCIVSIQFQHFFLVSVWSFTLTNM